MDRQIEFGADSCGYGARVSANQGGKVVFAGADRECVILLRHTPVKRSLQFVAGEFDDEQLFGAHPSVGSLHFREVRQDGRQPWLEVATRAQIVHQRRSQVHGDLNAGFPASFLDVEHALDSLGILLHCLGPEKESDAKQREQWRNKVGHGKGDSSRMPEICASLRASRNGTADLTGSLAADKIELMAAAETHEERVARLQRTLQTMADVDGWLFYDFRHSDPLAYRVLLLDPARHVTRRWYYWVPTTGAPVKLVHRIEPRALDPLPGDVRQYVSWESQQEELRRLLKGSRLVAMQYSPMNAIPYVSRVDAGTIDLIRSFGTTVITSADLVQTFEAVWTEEQLISHRVAADILRRVVDETFREVAEAMSSGRALTERALQQFMLGRFQVHGVVTASPPIVAVNAHSADPHYEPTPEQSLPIQQGDLILIDLWAKQPHQADAVYADITWTGYVGATVPARHEEVFQVVRRARDAAVDFVRGRAQTGSLPCGWEVDDVCRQVIRTAGFGDQFVHRTGHSIGEEVHGNGANIDNLETQDGRRLLPNTCFSIEPGIYLTGEFGIRSEVDVYVAERDALVFGQPVQTQIVPILA